MESQNASLIDAISKSMQGDQALRVVYRAAGFSLVGGLSGAGVAAYRYVPAIPAAFDSSLRTGISAFVFFSFREYLAVPTFSHLQRTGALPQAGTWLDKTYASSAAGFLTGAVLGGYHFRTANRTLTGGITFATAALTGQLLFNAANVYRIRYLTRNHAKVEASAAASPPIVLEDKPSILQRATESILSITPIRKLNDEEYSRTLRDKVAFGRQELDIIDAQMREAEAQLSTLERAQR